MCTETHRKVFILRKHTENYGEIAPRKQRGYDIRDCGCWEYNGFLDKDGYPLMNMSNAKSKSGTTSVYVYRFYYEYWVGPIPEGMEIDHLCRNRNCINPTHLEVVTRGENMRRAHIAAGWDTHCRRGHERSIFGWHEWNDARGPRRDCAECRRINRLKHQQSKLSLAA